MRTSFERDVEAVSKEFASDVVVAALAGTYHQKNSRWPKDLSELRASAGSSADASTWMGVSSIGPEGKDCLIFFGTAAEKNLRTIRIESPKAAGEPYVGKYLYDESSTIQLDASFKLNLNQQPLNKGKNT